ncbi:MAG: heme-binding protein [Deltaproteobacteria bacterium]|nr:heme-binding protein [Deltaproteobacteria bacterium]
MNIKLETALEVIAAAKKKAMEIGVPMVIAVADTGGNLLALQRMDEALLVSIEIAANKAYTAVALKMPTEELAKISQSGQPLFGINAVGGGKVIIFGGGIPLKKDGKIIGAIGVSGGSVEDDVKCAQAGVARLSELK